MRVRVLFNVCMTGCMFFILLTWHLEGTRYIFCLFEHYIFPTFSGTSSLRLCNSTRPPLHRYGGPARPWKLYTYVHARLINILYLNTALIKASRIARLDPGCSELRGNGRPLNHRWGCVSGREVRLLAMTLTWIPRSVVAVNEWTFVGDRVSSRGYILLRSRLVLFSTG